MLRRTALSLLAPYLAAPTAAWAVRVDVPPAPGALPRGSDTIVVVIDPGHGGDDLGAVGPGGTFEKTITLAVAQRLAARLAARPELEVVLSRRDDRRVSLTERLALASRLEADLLVSLHADSLPAHPLVRGASVYTLSTVPTDPAAARKARRENAGDRRLTGLAEVADGGVRAILTSLVRTANAQRSTALAARITEALAPIVPLLATPRRAADFVVLRSLRTPSVLVELGYLSNVDDETALRDPAHRDALADALHDAIVGYVVSAF